MSTILVTAATGNVGTHVVRELRARGEHVRAFVRDPPAAAERLGADVELARGDFGDVASLRHALDGVDRVWLASPNHPRQVEHELHVIDAARAARVRRLVKLSTTTARIGSPIPFWDWHGRIEEHLHRSGVPSIIVQASFLMSNLLASAASVRHAGVLAAPAGGARIAMIDPRDVAAVAAVALTVADHEGRTLAVTGPEAIGYEQVAEALSAATGQPVRFVAVPDDAARARMVESGMPAPLAATVVALYAALREGAAEAVTDTVRAVIGRAPRSIGEWAADHAAAFRAVASARPG